MEKDWLSPWMLAPFLAVPVIILDPYTLYCSALGDPEVLDGSPSAHDPGDLSNRSDIEESR
jgi:hypothetical protein